jgi:hypothetical protein
MIAFPLLISLSAGASERAQEDDMRFVIGVIVGVVLVVGGAYVRDTMALRNAAGQAPPPLLVNWDMVVGLLGR